MGFGADTVGEGVMRVVSFITEPGLIGRLLEEAGPLKAIMGA